MRFAEKLGLKDENFCRMTFKTKMFLSNVLGHVAELHYEKLKPNAIKAESDVPYDFILNNKTIQVKRWAQDGTDEEDIAVNLTKTHGQRRGLGNYYKRSDFNILAIFDVGFTRCFEIESNDIPQNKNYLECLPGSFKKQRIEENEKLSQFEKEFLEVQKQVNTAFPYAIEKFREKQGLTYLQLLEKCCNLEINDIDRVFSAENFRLITGGKGFAAEEHLKTLFDQHKIRYEHMKNMYSEFDFLVNGDIRVQVKIPNKIKNTINGWKVSTHKSHGSEEEEKTSTLYSIDRFDILALFIGYKIDEKICEYTPSSVDLKFIFIPISNLEQHPIYPGYLKRQVNIKNNVYQINDLSIFDKLKKNST